MKIIVCFLIMIVLSACQKQIDNATEISGIRTEVMLDIETGFKIYTPTNYWVETRFEKCKFFEIEVGAKANQYAKLFSEDCGIELLAKSVTVGEGKSILRFEPSKDEWECFYKPENENHEWIGVFFVEPF